MTSQNDRWSRLISSVGNVYLCKFAWNLKSAAFFRRMRIYAETDSWAAELANHSISMDETFPENLRMSANSEAETRLMN